MEIEIGNVIVEDAFELGEIKLNVIKLTVELEDLEVTPSTEEQNFEGRYANVKVEGSPNLLPENIKKDVDIFGVVGTAPVSDAKITDASSLFYNKARLDALDALLNMCDNPVSTQGMFSNCNRYLN